MSLDQVQPTTPEVDAPIVAVGAGQPEYNTIAGAQVTHPQYPFATELGWNTMLYAFRPDEAHREAIARGADVYVSLLTFGRPVSPILVHVGKEAAAAAYGITPTDVRTTMTAEAIQNEERDVVDRARLVAGWCRAGADSPVISHETAAVYMLAQELLGKLADEVGRLRGELSAFQALDYRVAEVRP